MCVKEDYDYIYGVSIDEYVKAHNTTVDSLLGKTEVDISLLKNAQQLEYNTKGLTRRVEDIGNAIRKKEAHRDRLLLWKQK